jgi:hypothetical protein
MDEGWQEPLIKTLGRTKEFVGKWNTCWGVAVPRCVLRFGTDMSCCRALTFEDMFRAIKVLQHRHACHARTEKIVQTTFYGGNAVSRNKSPEVLKICRDNMSRFVEPHRKISALNVVPNGEG